jgi:hypothetical protein
VPSDFIHTSSSPNGAASGRRAFIALATEKVDWPILTNLRLDPYERTGMYNGRDNGSLNYTTWFTYEFWRFVFVQQQVGKLARTAIDFPPMQAGASFNLDAIKAQIQKAMAHKAAE